MKRTKLFCVLIAICVYFSPLCFAQQNTFNSISIKGKIPDPKSDMQYRLQVGAFSILKNAEEAYIKLQDKGLYPSIEQNNKLLCVSIANVNAKDVPLFIANISQLGFREVLIKEHNTRVRNVVPPQKIRQSIPKSFENDYTDSLEDILLNFYYYGWEIANPDYSQESTVAVYEVVPSQYITDNVYR